MPDTANRSHADPVTTEFRQHHPKGLWWLFSTELWERFNFYGMRALLVLFMVYALGFDDREAAGVYAAYGTLVYALPLLGGFLADRYLGYRRAIIMGAVLMAIGEFALTVPHSLVTYLALGLICVGNGFFKPNISSTVGKLYAQGDPMRDRGFTIFYMGINIGAGVAPLLCSWVARELAEYDRAWDNARSYLTRQGVVVADDRAGAAPRVFEAEEMEKVLKLDLEQNEPIVGRAFAWYPSYVAEQTFRKYEQKRGGERGWTEVRKYLEDQGLAPLVNDALVGQEPGSAQEMARLVRFDFQDDPALLQAWLQWYAKELPTRAFHRYRESGGGEKGWAKAVAFLERWEVPVPSHFDAPTRQLATPEDMAAVLALDPVGNRALGTRLLGGWVVGHYESYLAREAYREYEKVTSAARRFGFAAAGVGMLISLFVFLRGQRYLEGAGLPPDPDRLFRPLFGPLNLQHLIWLGAFAIAPVTALMLNSHEITRYILYGVALFIFGYIFKVARAADMMQRHRIAVFGILWVFHTAFWALFEQAGSSLTLFAERNVQRSVDVAVWKGEFLTEWFQSVNPAFIVLLAPLFTSLWALLDRKHMNPSIPMKFGLGVVLLSLGYIVLVAGARAMAVDGLSPFLLLVLLYLLHTMGELCLSPVGLSAVTKLAPQAAVGFFMGAWFLSLSFAHSTAGLIAAETAIEPGTTRAESLDVYLGVYWKGGLVLLGMGVLLMLISRWVNKLTHGVK